MTKKPFFNALIASAYIIVGVLIMTFVSQPMKDKPDTLFTPVVFLSLLTLSVAIMAFLFFYQPLILLIEGKKKDALNFLIKTIGIFGIFTAIFSILLFSGLI